MLGVAGLPFLAACSFLWTLSKAPTPTKERLTLECSIFPSQGPPVYSKCSVHPEILTPTPTFSMVVSLTPRPHWTKCRRRSLVVTKTAEAPPCPLHFVGNCSYLLVALMPAWRGPDAERILVTSSCSVMMSSTLPLTLPPPSASAWGGLSPSSWLALNAHNLDHSVLCWLILCQLDTN